MYLKRNIDNLLQDWAKETEPKPLMLRGARQIGKTESVRNLGVLFKNFVEINFEYTPQVHEIFNKTLDPNEICIYLESFFNIKITEGNTLLFFDEVQSCIPAIQALRYFYEKKPSIHIIATGSLLEFVIQQIPSFGVGRIRSVFMYPLSFDEFLLANHQQILLDTKSKATCNLPLLDSLHNKLIDYYRKFLIIGGMPAVVKKFIETQSITACNLIMSDIINAYYDDFAKYKINANPIRIREIFNAILFQTGGKFVYSKASTASHVQIKDAITLLIMAGLVHPITHSSCNGLPIGAEANEKKQKMILFDTGIYLYLLGGNNSDILIDNNFNIVNKGFVSELFVGLEILKNGNMYNKQYLYYWSRENKSSNAEVDYVIAKNNNIIPIEVKAGTKGSMQSMYLFLKEKAKDIGYRVSNENFAQIENVNIYPVYAIANLLFGK